MASLGIQCGATRSFAILRWENQEIRLQFPPANYKLLSRSELQEFITQVQFSVEESLPAPFTVRRVGIGMPGILNDEHRNVVKSTLQNSFPNLENVWVGSDVQVAFKCLQEIPDEKHVKTLIIAGTGSVCCANSPAQDPTDVAGLAKIGGNGHILGDRGSGYAIGLAAIRASYRQLEYTGNSPLLAAIKSYLRIDTIPDLITWSVGASKTQIASLAKTVIQTWTQTKDEVATAVVQNAIQDLTQDFTQLVKKLSLQDGTRVLLGFTGSLLTKSPEYAAALSEKIRAGLPNVDIEILKDTVKGALMYTREETQQLEEISEESILRKKILPVLTSLSVTEMRNQGSKDLDKMLVLEGIELMLKEEKKIHVEIRKEAGKIAQLALKIAKAFKNGGRLIYVGAGSSGRLGILDAAECPPTFKAPHHWVQGIIAGGSAAVFRAVEGAEDSTVGGALSIRARGVNEKDVVLGIAASGRTPFVWGALSEAINAKAFTAFLTFNPNLEITLPLNIVMTFNVGPEVLTGSTRLKCGTATKIILNMLTTLSMVKYGKVLENLMVDLNASNEKLRERAVRIVLAILNAEEPRVTAEEAKAALEENEFDIKTAVQNLRGPDYEDEYQHSKYFTNTNGI